MSTLNDNLTRLSLARTNIASAIIAKGGTVGQNDGFEDFVSDIASIPGASTIYGTVIKTSDASSTFISEAYFDTDTYAYRTNNTIIFYIHMKTYYSGGYREFYYSYIGISGLLNNSETVNLNSGFLITKYGRASSNSDFYLYNFDTHTIITNQILVINGSTSFYLGSYYSDAYMIGCIEIN